MENKKNAKVLESLRNAIRFVEMTDKATNETTTARRVVKVKASDFDSRDVARLYRSHILRLANAVDTFCKADKDDKGAEFRAVNDAMTAIFRFFEVECGAPACKARNSETRFLLESVTRHKFARTADGAAPTLDRVREIKSLDGIRGDMEEIAYYRYNGKALPSVVTSASVVKANAAAASADAKAAAKAEKEADNAAAERAKKASKPADAPKVAEKSKKVATAA